MTLTSSTRICDTRELGDFVRRHIEGAVHIPLSGLMELLCALPPRHVPILFIVDSDAAKDTCQSLASRLGMQDAVVAQCEDLPVTLPLRWVTSAAPDPSLRLWDPNELLASQVDVVERALGGPSVAFDLGCGTARDMIYLEQRGWATIGFDNRQKLLRQAVKMSRLHEEHVDVLLLHLKRVFPIRRGSIDLVLMSRFLYRPLLPEVLLLVRIGGFLMVSHFLDGCQDTDVGTPSTIDGFLLRSELSALCETSEFSFDILVDDECRLADGRPISKFLARRTA